MCAVKRINFVNDEIIDQIIKAQDEKMEINKQSTKPVPKKNKNGMVVDLGKFSYLNSPLVFHYRKWRAKGREP